MEKSKSQLEQRCRRLGHIVQFQYCMECGDEELPCSKIVDCWWECFDIIEYLKNCLSKEDFTRLVNTPKQPKVASLVDLIKQAQDRVK
jgi:hypothetical protein